MSASVLVDPFVASHGVTLTPFHLIVLLFGALSLVVSQANLPPDIAHLVGMWRRAMVLLVIALVIHGIISSQITMRRDRIKRLAEIFKARELDKAAKLEKKANAWDNPSSHPSQFLTTKDGKPRLFPFPLGKAGGSKGLKGELWWEAGNTPHVGHFNQRETPEGREALREEMEDQEKERADKAKKEIKAYEDSRKKWAKRLANLKILSGIVVIGLFHRKAAVICLAGLIYYVFATELAGMLKPKDKDEEEPPLRRKKVLITPGMAMTYLYEPTKGGGVKEYNSIPVAAPSHRLMTSTDSRYAS